MSADETLEVSTWRSPRGERHSRSQDQPRPGGEYVDGTHFSYAGGQIRSFLSLISYFSKGENRERYLGVKIPPSMLKADYVEQARAFANELADGLQPSGELVENRPAVGGENS